MSRAICILGMHRSGTSCLTGSLEEAGLHLGEVFRVGEFNAKGNRENGRIMALHEAVLGHSGGGWDNPPAAISWSDAHRAERDAIIRSYADVPVWGFKDPRTILLVNFWKEAIPDLRLVATLRHPLLVAQSLRHRGGGLIADWLALWANYNQRLLALYDAEPFPIVRFDLGGAAYLRSLAMAMASLGLQPPERMAFFDPGLRHQEASPVEQMPDSVARLYGKMCRIAIDDAPGR